MPFVLTPQLWNRPLSMLPATAPGGAVAIDAPASPVAAPAASAEGAGANSANANVANASAMGKSDVDLVIACLL